MDELKQLRLEKLLKAQDINKTCALYEERIALYQQVDGDPQHRLNYMIENVDIIDNFTRELSETLERQLIEYANIKQLISNVEEVQKREKVR